MAAGNRPPQSVRLPTNYQFVLDVVREQGMGMHATTSEIFAAAKRRRPRIGYTTVYRALHRLRELGLVLEVRIPGTLSAVYEPAAPNHAHFHCRRCGRVEDIAYTLPSGALEAVADPRGIEINDVSLTFHGVCADCRREQNP